MKNKYIYRVKTNVHNFTYEISKHLILEERESYFIVEIKSYYEYGRVLKVTVLKRDIGKSTILTWYTSLKSLKNGLREYNEYSKNWLLERLNVVEELKSEINKFGTKDIRDSLLI